MSINSKHPTLLILSFLILKCQGMESPPVLQKDQMPAEFAGIPIKELEIYQNYNKKQRFQLSELLMHLGNAFEDSTIRAKRERKLKKRLAIYNSEQKSLLFKGFISAAGAGGFGYCAHKGCTIPETTAVAGVFSVGFGLLALNYAYDWYNLPKPTYALIAENLEQKIRNCHDWRPIVAKKIKKICVQRSIERNK